MIYFLIVFFFFLKTSVTNIGDVETAKKIFEIKPGTKGKVTDEGHFGNILALAISSDGKHLASAGTDKLIKVWDTRSNTLIDSFKGHRGAISVQTKYSFLVYTN